MLKSQLFQPKLDLKKLTYLAKNNFWTKDGTTTASSRFLTEFELDKNATVIQLLNQAGAILKGKAEMDEFACGGTGLLAYGNLITNPYDSQRISGGSSSGSAVAVAKKKVTFALGSDTGDSVRRPAAYCGIVGFRPTYGRVSRYGLIPMASSLDTVGILARSLKITQKIFSVIAQPDPNDLWTLVKSPKFRSIPKKKIAVFWQIEKFLPEQFAQLYQKVLNILEKTYQIKTIKLPPEIQENLQLVYLIICSSELVSHLNACQGVTYGSKNSNFSNQEIPKLRTDFLGKSVRQRLLLGSYFLAKKRDLKRAYQLQERIKSWTKKIFARYDFLLFPSPNSPAPQIEKESFFFTGEKDHWSDSLLLLASLAGFPSLTLPIGWVDNLPVSINLNASNQNDYSLFQVAGLLEKSLEKSEINHQG